MLKCARCLLMHVPHRCHAHLAARARQGSDSYIDSSYVKYQAQYHMDNGVDMVILQGTTGEWPALTVRTRLCPLPPPPALQPQWWGRPRASCQHRKTCV